MAPSEVQDHRRARPAQTLRRGRRARLAREVRCPIRGLNKEIKRHTEVVGVFPNPEALLRLAAWCSSKPATNGRPASAATCPKDP